MTRINYKTDREYWRLKADLLNKGFKLTADAYWCQIFENDSGEEIILDRE
ncbi:MAG: hypothetical protein LUC97_05465 [Clostridiales bacterium]|nr:hypothetical protein [Clostridiales bacterium]